MCLAPRADPPGLALPIRRRCACECPCVRDIGGAGGRRPSNSGRLAATSLPDEPGTSAKRLSTEATASLEPVDVFLAATVAATLVLCADPGSLVAGWVRSDRGGLVGRGGVGQPGFSGLGRILVVWDRGGVVCVVVSWAGGGAVGATLRTRFSQSTTQAGLGWVVFLPSSGVSGLVGVVDRGAPRFARACFSGEHPVHTNTHDSCNMVMNMPAAPILVRNSVSVQCACSKCGIQAINFTNIACAVQSATKWHESGRNGDPMEQVSNTHVPFAIVGSEREQPSKWTSGQRRANAERAAPHACDTSGAEMPPAERTRRGPMLGPTNAKSAMGSSVARPSHRAVLDTDGRRTVRCTLRPSRAA